MKILIVVSSVLVVMVAGLTGLYFKQTGKSVFQGTSSPQTSSLSGVLKLGRQLFSPKDYCPSQTYIESSEGRIMLLKDQNANLPSFTLLANVNKVVDLTGTFNKGKECVEELGCECEDYIEVETLVIDNQRSLEYAKELPSYDGTIHCLIVEGSCTPILNVSSGESYELIDPVGIYQLDEEGKHVRVRGTFDLDHIGAATVSGSIYVAFSESI